MKEKMKLTKLEKSWILYDIGNSAFILLVSFTNVREGEIPVSVILVALIFIGQQVYEGLFVQDNVSNLSHILGGIVGAVVGYRLNVGKKKAS